MIGRLKGTLVAKQPPSLLVDVNGVGYELDAPMSTFYDLPAAGQPVTLLTHLVVREDSQTLYGFMREADRALFRRLIRVSGIGARMALSILSGMSADEFARCIEAGDVTALSRTPGIGKKTAERLIVEMRGKLESPVPTAPGGGAPGDARTEAAGALVALGYKPAEASKMVEQAAEADLGAEQIIRKALKSRGARP